VVKDRPHYLVVNADESMRLIEPDGSRVIGVYGKANARDVSGFRYLQKGFQHSGAISLPPRSLGHAKSQPHVTAFRIQVAIGYGYTACLKNEGNDVSLNDFARTQ
jgi:hypothetical protein